MKAKTKSLTLSTDTCSEKSRNKFKMKCANLIKPLYNHIYSFKCGIINCIMTFCAQINLWCVLGKKIEQIQRRWRQTLCVFVLWKEKVETRERARIHCALINLYQFYRISITDSFAFDVIILMCWCNLLLLCAVILHFANQIKATFVYVFWTLDSNLNLEMKLFVRMAKTSQEMRIQSSMWQIAMVAKRHNNDGTS